MFRKALIKMTLFYLLILMTISLFFSMALYQISTQEIQGSLTRQQKVIERVGPFMHDFLEDPNVVAQRDTALKIATSRIIFQLLYTNLGILIVGGGLSYYLALLTIRPIEKAHEAQARFTGDASHELRSPLASMKTEIEVALRDKNLTKEEAVEVLKSNLEEVEKLSSLSGHLLELTKEDGGNLSLERSDLEKIVLESVAAVEKQANQKKVKIKTEVAKNLTVCANPESLKELLVILLDNAVKYSPENTQIEVAARSLGRQVELRVTDQGFGIKESDLPYIFERFFRADQSRSKNVIEGYGLGLPLAKKIAMANRAELSVKSKVGKGSTFYIRLNH